MKTTTSPLYAISEGLQLSSLFIMALPLAFPVAALLDGAGDAYTVSAIAYLAFAYILAIPAIGLCAFFSDLCESIADMAAREREETRKALHAYLLNGGRA